MILQFYSKVLDYNLRGSIEESSCEHLIYGDDQLASFRSLRLHFAQQTGMAFLDR